MSRRHNTALARNPHMFHMAYGCDGSGNHTASCGQGTSKSAMRRRARNGRRFKSDRHLGLISRFLSENNMGKAFSRAAKISTRRKTGEK